MKGLVLAALVLATAPLYADYTPFYLGLLTEVLSSVFAATTCSSATRGCSRSGTPRSSGGAYVTGILLALHPPARARSSRGAGGLVSP